MPSNRPDSQIQEAITSTLTVIVLHAGDAKENAAYVRGLAERGTLFTPELHTTEQQVKEALDHINKAHRLLNSAKQTLRSSQG